MTQLLIHDVNVKLPKYKTKVTAAIAEERCSAYLDVDGMWYDCSNGHACREIKPTHWIEEKPICVKWEDVDIELDEVIRLKGYINGIVVFQIFKKLSTPDVYSLHSFDSTNNWLFTGSLDDCKRRAIDKFSNFDSMQ